jgi:SAM-dependent methyltransferase
MWSLAETIERLPAPFHQEKFSSFRQGIYDCGETAVFINDERDFAFLYPRPEFSYQSYKPRVVALNLATYKKTLPVVTRRYEKIRDYLSNPKSMLEIGAADAAFLAYVKSRSPDIELASLEVDRNTRSGRDALPGLVQYETFDEIDTNGRRFGTVCMFHVLEHIFDPAEMLHKCIACLAPKGHLVIEVPSLDDPLLSLYHVEAYQQFYFQRQHPYIYSKRSLGRLINALGLGLVELIGHQRYGLENHLQWLARGVPGGNERFRDAFGDCEDSYITALERAGHADSVIAIASAPEV